MRLLVAVRVAVAAVCAATLLGCEAQGGGPGAGGDGGPHRPDRDALAAATR